MVAPTTPAATKLFGAPPTTLGAPSGWLSPLLSLWPLSSSRSARSPLTLNSSGRLSVVPRKFTPGVVPALPFKVHAAATVEAFVQTRLVSLNDNTWPLAGELGVFN